MLDGFFLTGRSDGLTKRLKGFVRLGEQISDSLQNGIGSADQHRTIPEEVSRVEKTFGGGEIRLLGKRLYRDRYRLVGLMIGRTVELDVTIPGFLLRWSVGDVYDR